MEPTYDEIKAFIEDGHTQIEAAQHFYADLSTSAGRSRVQRIIKAGEDHRGPTERAIDNLIARTFDLSDEVQAARAQNLRNAAIMADRGCTIPTGAAMSAGVTANKQLEDMLASLGQSSGADDLIAALRAE